MFQPLSRSLNDQSVVESWLFALGNKGYFRIAEFVSPKLRSMLEEEVNQLCRKLGSQSTQHRGLRNSSGDVIVMNRLDVESDFLFDVARSREMLALAECLLAKAAIPLHVEFFCKPPNSPFETPAHQDQIFYVDHFDHELALSFWVPLDDVTCNSGALQYCPTKIRRLLSHRESSSTDFYRELSPEALHNLEEFETVVVPSGGCIVHHSFVIHRAGPNTTTAPRRAIVFNYRGSPWRQMLKEQNVQHNAISL